MCIKHISQQGKKPDRRRKSNSDAADDAVGADISDEVRGEKRAGQDVGSMLDTTHVQLDGEESLVAGQQMDQFALSSSEWEYAMPTQSTTHGQSEEMLSNSQPLNDVHTGTFHDKSHLELLHDSPSFQAPNSFMCAQTNAQATTLALKHWIVQALNAAGTSGNAIASHTYLRACLKIAISLTKQASHAFEHEDVPPIGSNSEWSLYTVVHLKSNDHASHTMDLNGQFERFLQQFGVDDYEGENAGHADDIDQQLKSFLSSEIENGEHSGEPRDEMDSLCVRKPTQQLDILDVHSAEIKCPDSKPSHSDDEVGMIFRLGLLLYEIFSGGQSSSALQALASTDGSFVSLSRLTMMPQSSNDHNQAKRHQGTSGSRREMGLCQMSCEYLNFLGAPSVLCSVIANMLEGVYGDLRGNEAYSTIKDVTADLELMLSKPKKFLRELDTEQLSLNGLQLDAFEFSRDEEYECIRSCYARFIGIDGSSEAVIIKGESGSGKTFLCNRVSQFIQAEGGMFLTAKFDQLQQARPLSALSSAFDEYCQILLHGKDSNWAIGVVNQLKTSLGRDARYLTSIIPKLSLVLGTDAPMAEYDFNENCQTSVHRLYLLICKFVDVVCTSSAVSVTLLADDAQWADGASIAVLTRLLKQKHRNFFFIACCRDEEMIDGHPFFKMIDTLNTFGVYSTTVRLGRVDEVDIEDAVSGALYLLPRQVKSLSRILHNKTMGNILYVLQIMLSLYRDGLLYLDLGRKRWAWDETQIAAMDLPDNIALCYAKRIGKLDPEVQLVLHLVSMFGSSVKFNCVEFIGAQLNMKIGEPLHKAETVGLVSIIDGCISFSHDMIQQAAYEMISEQDRNASHLIYGRCLIQFAEDINNEEVLFAAVNQLNLGGHGGVSETEECFVFAKYNLMAGQRAMNMSQFSNAYTLLNHAVQFLRQSNENVWVQEERYPFVLELYELTCKAALAVGDVQGLKMFAEEVLKNAKHADDKVKTQMVVVSNLAYASKIRQALQLGLVILAQLGEELSNNPTQEEIDQSVLGATSLLMVTADSVLGLPLMTDRKKLNAMRILAQIQIISIFVNPSQQPLIVSRMVNLTIRYGKHILYSRQ